MDRSGDPYLREGETMPTTEAPTTTRIALEPFERRCAGLDPSQEGARVLILAGGDGARLRPVTRVLAGDDRPKQFCALVGQEPLLVQTARRAATIAAPENILFLLSRHHEPYYADIVAETNPSSLVIQPGNRGTATAVLH